MSFFKEAGNALGLDWIKLSTGYQLIDYNGEAMYIEGVKRIISIDKTLISLDVGKKTLEISGENLEVFDVSGADMMIKGRIAAIILPDFKPESESGESPQNGAGEDQHGKIGTNVEVAREKAESRK